LWSCESRTLPRRVYFFHSAIAQLAERMTVNHDVVGSSPTCGVFCIEWRQLLRWRVVREAEGARLEIVWAGDRLKGSNPLLSVRNRREYKEGPLVKWLRHRPFTAVTRVRIPYGS